MFGTYNIFINNVGSREVMDFVTNELGYMGLDNPIVERSDSAGGTELICEFGSTFAAEDFIYELEDKYREVSAFEL